MKEGAMNWFEPPEGVTQRVIARCGVVHPHAELDPKRTALVVVDLQNAFMDDTVGHAVCPMARDIVPQVNRLASVVRGVGGGVFWIKNTFDERGAYGVEQRPCDADPGQPAAPHRGDDRGHQGP